MMTTSTTTITSRIQLLLLISILMSQTCFLLVEAFMGSLRNKEQPVRLRIHKKATQKVKTLLIDNDDDNNNEWLLQEYMQLPAAQYACVPLPIKASLERVYGKADEFTLQVPTMQFPISTKSGGEIEITPKVRTKVTVEPDRVVIQSLSCSIDGSPAVQEWNLNERYEVDVCAILTWEKNKGNTNSNGIFGGAGSSNTFSAPASSSSIPDSSSSSTTPATTSPSTNSAASFQEDMIRIQTDLAVDVYLPQVKRVQMIPKRLWAKIGNTVLKYVVGLLLEAFLEGLQQDYEQWASCPDYRADRAKLEEELQLELKQLQIEQEKQEERELRRQKQEQRRQQGRTSRMEDDTSAPSPPQGHAFSFHNLPAVGGLFLQPRRGGGGGRASSTSVAATATANTAATTRLHPHHHHHHKLRRGERIIRLIRRNNRSSV